MSGGARCDQASAKGARRKAAHWRGEATRARNGNTLDGSTAFRRFAARAVKAFEMRAETEIRIAEMYEKGDA